MTTENEKYKASLLRYLKRKKEHPHCYSEECKRHYDTFPFSRYPASKEYELVADWMLEGIL